MSFIQGNITGIRQRLLDQLASLETRRFEVIIPSEVYHLLLDISENLNREIALALDKKGRVEYLSIGDSKNAPITKKAHLVIHTHPRSTSELSELDLSIVKSGCAKAIIAISSYSDQIQLAYMNENQVLLIEKYPYDFLFNTPIEKLYFNTKLVETEENELEEKALLVAFDIEGAQELEGLCQTAGIKVLECEIIKIRQYHPGFLIGQGKIIEIRQKAQLLQADLLIFERELTPVQLKNIEETTGLKTVDRTTLILDIFAQRARSREGKLQVELAQLKHLLPRLIGHGQSLSRLGGGVGTRGPGETKLEQDRRRIKKRISILTQELANLQKHRQNQTKQRFVTNIPQICLAGYTNAGKSTLLNQLTDTNVLAEDKLFATLDTTTRRLVLPSGQVALLTDTVGFIRNLPPSLMAAFRTTLEENLRSDLILHVVDASNPYARNHIEVVDGIFCQLKLDDIRKLIIFNKIDLVQDSDQLRILTHDLNHDYVFISAAKEKGIDQLLWKIDNIISNIYSYKQGSWIIPYKQASLIKYLREHGIVVEEIYTENGILVKGKVETAFSKNLELFEI